MTVRLGNRFVNFTDEAEYKFNDRILKLALNNKNEIYFTMSSPKGLLWDACISIDNIIYSMEDDKYYLIQNDDCYVQLIFFREQIDNFIKTHLSGKSYIKPLSFKKIILKSYDNLFSDNDFIVMTLFYIIDIDKNNKETLWAHPDTKYMYIKDNKAVVSRRNFQYMMKDKDIDVIFDNSYDEYECLLKVNAKNNKLSIYDLISGWEIVFDREDVILDEHLKYTFKADSHSGVYINPEKKEVIHQIITKWLN